MAGFVFVLLIIAMLVTMTPPALWFIMNIKKYRETYNLKFKRIVFWSWFVCLGIDILIALVIVFGIFVF